MWWKALLILAAAAGVFFLYQDEIMLMRQEDPAVVLRSLPQDRRIYWISIPLFLFQNIITIFPVLILIVLHLLILPPFEALLTASLAASAGAWLCFKMVRLFGEGWLRSWWTSSDNKRRRRLMGWMERYGMAAVIAARSIPVLPGSLISAAAAAVPMSEKTYVAGSSVGTISMVLFFSIISMPVWYPDGSAMWIWLVLYGLFLAVVLFAAWKIGGRGVNYDA
ncbi:TVP38/TMEM64 family protein [Alkalicoccus urumqiensis]|uniref:VTT domain-containing protein n=1 Tax=Alkalicoccus urumqiensis TaxID=1548213 RepID=A0A2P6MDT2_ALKUR|nr:VTT domain-containing protein [Alkalicoccus urumqiensis]PRO64445.1 hypothetical protein C6I21_14695 [Alkalicoccus urumqiensis]